MTNWIADNLAGLVLPMPQGLPEMLPGGWFESVLRESQHREKTAADLGLRFPGFDFGAIDAPSMEEQYEQWVKATDAPYSFWLGADNG